MKLIIAAGIYPPDIGGPATYSKKVADEFSKRGWDVKVLTYADVDTNQRETENETTRKFKIVKVFRAHNIFVRYFLYALNLCKLAKRADLIYAQGPVSEGLPAYFASKLMGKKYILKVVGDPAWERLLSRNQENKKPRKQEIGNLEIEKNRNWKFPPEADPPLAEEIGNYNARFFVTPQSPLVTAACEREYYRTIQEFIDLEAFQRMKGLPFKTKILRWVERIVAKNASKIITPSEYLKKIVMGWGIPDSKVKVIYNSVNEEDNVIGGNYEEIKKLRNSPREMKQAISRGKEIRNSEEDIILSAGRLVPWKGFDLLIDIMPELLSVNPNFKLVIVGDGLEMISLKSKVKSQKLCENEKIILIGKLEHQELLDLMRKAKMFVLNSGYEGLSHVIIEAMQAGLPCAVSNKGGNSELVENEKTGLLFEYNNREQVIAAIKRLWKDEDLRERVAAGGYEKIKKFGFERMIEETAEILEIGN